MGVWSKSKFYNSFLVKLYEQVKPKTILNGDNSATDFIKAIFRPLKLSVGVKNPISGSDARVEWDASRYNLDPQQSIIDTYISENFALKKSIEYILNHEYIREKKIVVFIDDLDRCDVNRVMEVIESIKLIFNSDNCIFFLGCDVEYIDNALEEKYSNFKSYNRNIKKFSKEYLEKIIQIPFHIPKITDESIVTYIDSIMKNSIDKESIKPISQNLFKNFKNDFKTEYVAKLMRVVNINPRRIKRIVNLSFLNYVFMKHKNMENNNLKIDSKLLILITIINEVYHEYYINNLSTKKKFIDKAKEFYDQYNDNEVPAIVVNECSNNGENEKNLLVYNTDHNKLNNDDKNLELYEDMINGLFYIYYEYNKLKIKNINEFFNNISLYISVSNLSSINTEEDIEWGEISKIKSEITQKNLKNFLRNVDKTDINVDFIYWFFNDIYLENRDKFTLGIVKNVQVVYK